MKRNIAYVKPQDPTFLAKLKAQIGYQDREDALDAKRPKPAGDNHSSDDENFAHEREDEQPQYVTPDGREQLPKDLVKQITTEKSDEAKADLEQRIVFKKKKKNSSTVEGGEASAHPKSTTVASSSRSSSGSGQQKPIEKVKKPKKVTPKLSFDPEEDEEADE